MNRRMLSLAVACAGALPALSCITVPPHRTVNQEFVGCFTGPVTSFPTPPTVTLVLQAPPGDTSAYGLTGCFVVRGSVTLSASVAGMVRQDDFTIADLTATLAGGDTQSFIVERQPPTGETQTLNLSNEMGFLAQSLTRCTQTCVGLGVPQP